MGSARYSNITRPQLSEPMTGNTEGLALLRKSLETLAQSDNQRLEPVHPSRFVRAMQTARRQRAAFFNGDLFADPSWDILLELYARHLEGYRITVSKLCSAAHVPTTTALRWIARLEQNGLLIREQDASDARRMWLELSRTAADGMRGYMQAMSFASESI